MTTVSFDRFGPTPQYPSELGLETDAEREERLELERDEAELREEFGTMIRDMYDAYAEKFGPDGMDERVHDIAVFMGVIAEE
tara:strand:+ start:1155 stop:1400 length:246 start_codon:yes stop_codon:yes gene_type:complete